jgi:hypothetical protein
VDFAPINDMLSSTEESYTTIVVPFNNDDSLDSVTVVSVSSNKVAEVEEKRDSTVAVALASKDLIFDRDFCWTFLVCCSVGVGIVQPYATFTADMFLRVVLSKDKKNPIQLMRKRNKGMKKKPILLSEARVLLLLLFLMYECKSIILFELHLKLLESLWYAAEDNNIGIIHGGSRGGKCRDLMCSMFGVIFLETENVKTSFS